MDEEKLNELKEQGAMSDNTRLEELMREEITPEMQREFFEILKESQLLMPVTFSPNMFEGIENAKEGDVFEPQGQAGFNINYLKDNQGNRVLPLYTSDSAMEEAGVRSSIYALFMSDLADMLRQTDKYAVISINPFTDHDINLPVPAFLSLFDEPSDDVREFFESMNEILKVMREHSIELDDNYLFVVRMDENVMRQQAVDGVFVPNVPMSVSSNRDFRMDLKYTNLIGMPKGSKALPIGNNGKDEFDTLIAPGSEFKIINELDEFTTLWECVAQPFYDE